MKKTIYLIRHSLKEKMYGENESNDSKQIKDEKRILSIEGEQLAYQLSLLDDVKNIEEIWCSNYVRTMETAKYINRGILPLNISDSFDERHYGDFDDNTFKEEFWINQFKDEKLKNKNGESQEEVRKRFDDKINYILDNSKNSRIAIVTHNSGTLFYLLKYCKLVDAQIPKKLTISFNDKILIKDGIMESPSIMKLDFEDRELLNIEYIKVK